MNAIEVAQLGTVQQTMLIPLWARATEHQQRRPIIRDPKAKEIVGSLKYDFESFRRFPRTMLGCCIRSNVFDGWIREFLAQASEAAVIEIGAGMDTTFDRMDDGRVTWYEIDFPDILQLRSKFFKETSRRRFFAESVLDGEWVDQVRSAGHQSFLFQAAGVLMYWPEEEVRRLFSMLADQFPGALILFDACSRWSQRNAPRWEAALQETNAEFRWGIDDPRSVHDWDSRFQVLAIEHHLDHFSHRWPLWLRVAKTLVPTIRRSFSLNLVRLG